MNHFNPQWDPAWAEWGLAVAWVREVDVRASNSDLVARKTNKPNPVNRGNDRAVVSKVEAGPAVRE